MTAGGAASRCPAGDASPRDEDVMVQAAHRCQRDDECRMSCAFGAIRGDWYGWKDLAAHECRDGCAAKGTCAGCEDGMPEPSPAASLQAGSATER